MSHPGRGADSDTFFPRLALLGAIVVLAGAAAPALGQVALRGGGRLEAPVTRVGPEGVTVGASAGDPARTISWGLIRAVEGEHAKEAEAFGAVADRVWRALARLDRGDVGLAEPALEELFAQAIPAPTGADVAGALLRCRLRRGASASAIPVWLACVRLGATEGEALGREGVIDPETLLAPALPPIFLDTPGVRAFAASAPASAPGTSGTPAHGGAGSAGGAADVMGALYLLAAADALRPRGGAGASDAARAALESTGAFTSDAAPGVALVRAMVVSRIGEREARVRARGELIAGLDKHAGGWQEAWRRTAIGLSLVRETDAAERRRGAIELLHVPARFGASQPYLAGVALAAASEALAADGDAESAAALRAELEMEYPGHPALLRLPSPATRKGGT